MKIEGQPKLSFTKPNIDACIAAPIYTAQSNTPITVEERGRPPISPAIVQITPVTILNTPTTKSIMVAGSWLLKKGKQTSPKQAIMDAKMSIGSLLPLNTLSVISGNTNIAHACPKGSTI